MAKIKYILQSKLENVPIYLRLSISRKLVFKRKTGLTINPKDWSKTTGLPKQNNPTNKNLSTTLQKLHTAILEQLNISQSKGETINGDWLQYQIDLYFNRIQKENTFSDLLTDNIQRIIDTAQRRKNGKGGIGLSKSRINSYKTLLKSVKEYEKRKRIKLKIKDIDLRFKNNFITFLEKENYSLSYSQKKISDIKTVCLDAQKIGIETSSQLSEVTGIKPKNDYINYLTPDELQQIENTQFKSKALQNAKKWLLLGAMIGQRGNDLLNITNENIINKGNYRFIEIIQQKGNKPIYIPIYPQLDEFIKTNGLPYKISIQKFNQYLKEILKIAGIDTIVEGYKFNPKTKRKELGKYSKYEIIASHDLRRTFATNYYGTLPTPLIMEVTGHANEKTFLNYIGKSEIDRAIQLAKFMENMPVKKQPKLVVLNNKQKAI